jgi:hypothetical protein
MQRNTIALSFLALTLCGAAGASVAAPANDNGWVGPAAAGADRVIEVTPGTRHLNVTNGETVTIRQGEQSVTWQVQAPNNLNAVPLSRIAPQQQEQAGSDVLIYIAPGQQYQNS